MQGLRLVFLKYFNSMSDKSVKIINISFIASLFLIFIFTSSSLFSLRSEYDMKQFFPKNHALIEQERRAIAHFHLQEKSNIVLILNAPERSQWLNVESLKQLREFTLSAEKIPGVKKVVGLGNLQGTFEAGKELFVGGLLEQVPEKFWNKVIANHSFIKPNFLSQDLKSSLLIVELVDNTPETISNFKNNLNQIQSAQFSNFSLQYAGVPIIQSDVAILLKSELNRSVGLGLVVFIIVLSFIFANISGLAISLIALVFTNSIILGFLSWLGIKLDVLLSTLPVLISLSTISLTVQIILRTVRAENYKSQNVKLKFLGLLNEFKKYSLEFFLASVAPSIGFLMLAFSDVGIIKKYGLVVSSTIIAVWFLAQILLLPLLTLFSPIQLRAWIDKKAYWSLSIFKFKTVFVYSTYALIFLSALSFWFLNWNTRLFDDLPKNNVSRLNTENIDRSFGGTIPVSLVLFGSSQYWVEPKNLKQLDLLAKEIEKLQSVGSVISAVDFFKKSSTKGLRLPASKAENTESLFLFSMAEADPTLQYLNPLNHLTRLEIRLKDKPYFEVEKDISLIKYSVKKYFPQLNYNLSGMGVSAHQLNAEMSKELIFGFWQSLLFIALVLVFVFRSFKWAFVACLPNLVPPFALILALSISKTAIKPSVAIIFSIAVGLAFTNTVFLLLRLRKSLARHRLQFYLPVKNMILEEMTPCLMSTLLTASGFVVFVFSYFQMNQTFGVYMILSILAGAFGDLLFLPAFLDKYSGFLLSASSSSAAKKLPAATFMVTLLFFLFPKNSLAASTTDVQVLLKKSQQLLASQDDSADVLLKIVEADGSVKERKMVLKRKSNAQKNMTLVKMKTPQDLKGAAFLNIIDKGEENQWLYLPSTKQVRRIMGQNKKSGVLGSELTAEDLDLNTVKGSQAKLVKELKSGSTTYALIEVVSTTNETQYSKALILFNLATSLPARMEYFNQQNKAVKRIEFEKYVQVGKVFRAQSIKIKNLVNKRGTDLELTNIKSNSGLTEDEFSQRALSRD